MHRSANVSGNLPIAAITFGHQHENFTALIEYGSSPLLLETGADEVPLSSTGAEGRGEEAISTSADFRPESLDLRLSAWFATLHTYAVFFVYPEFKIPLNSSFPCKKVSASSINNVGLVC
jgi:hypothetical protein